MNGKDPCCMYFMYSIMRHFLSISHDTWELNCERKLSLLKGGGFAVIPMHVSLRSPADMGHCSCLMLLRPRTRLSSRSARLFANVFRHNANGMPVG
jgi:acetolactate synthase regulatory subunit